MVVGLIVFLSSANLICRSSDISKCFIQSLRFRDNESRLYYDEPWYSNIEMLKSKTGVKQSNTAYWYDVLEQSWLDPLEKYYHIVIAENTQAQHFDNLISKLHASVLKNNNTVLYKACQYECFVSCFIL